VASEEEFLRTELIGDGDNIGSEFGERIVSSATGLAAGVVAALIGDDDAEASRGERFDLFVPRIPKFGEAVEQEDDGALWRACGDGVDFDRAVSEGQVFKRNWHGAEFTWMCNGNMHRASGRGPSRINKPRPYEPCDYFQFGDEQAPPAEAASTSLWTGEAGISRSWPLGFSICCRAASCCAFQSSGGR